jgi:uncharacterized membrane protein
MKPVELLRPAATPSPDRFGAGDPHTKEIPMNKSNAMAGLALAAAAASLFASGLAGAADESSSGVQIKCFGANACKGHGQCKTSMNECKGHNACKGKGFVEMTEQACIEKLGRG